MIHLALEVPLELCFIKGLLQITWEMSSYLLHMPRLPALGVLSSFPGDSDLLILPT